MKNKATRRELLKLSAAGVLGTVIGAKILGSSVQALAEGAAAGAPPMEMLKETDPQAQALGYFLDAKKVDTKKWTKRATPEGAKQFCYNCQFYQTSAKDPKATQSAPCQILGMKGVTANGWCNTWTQNPKVKG